MLATTQFYSARIEKPAGKSQQKQRDWAQPRPESGSVILSQLWWIENHVTQLASAAAV
jgi:hypothetical protein